MHLSDFIVVSILKEGRGRYGDNLCAQTRSFGLGCASKLRQRIRALKAEVAAEQAAGNYTGGTALVLADVYKAEQTANLAIMPANLKTGRAGKPAEAEQWREGRQYAEKLSLNVAIKETKRERLN